MGMNAIMKRKNDDIVKKTGSRRVGSSGRINKIVVKFWVETAKDETDTI